MLRRLGDVSLQNARNVNVATTALLERLLLLARNPVSPFTKVAPAGRS